MRMRNYEISESMFNSIREWSRNCNTDKTMDEYLSTVDFGDWYLKDGALYDSEMNYIGEVDLENKTYFKGE